MTNRVRLNLSDSRPGPIRARMSDTLENFVTQMGTPADKDYFTRWITTNLTPEQILAAYKGDWIARKVIDIPADDATREWRSWEADNQDITLIEELEKKLLIQRKVMLADRRGRAFGGAAIVIGLDQGRADEPIEIERIQKDSLKFIHVVNRHELTTESLEMDITSPYYGQPAMYNVNSNAVQTRIHPSRVVRFIGAEPLDPIRDGTGWGDSVLQIVADAIRACGTVSQNIASLLHELQVDIVGIPDLINQMGSADYEARLKRRFGLAATTKSIHKVLLLDKEEEWNRVQANVAGMHDLIKVYLLIASGAADIPATRFLGQSPQGMNATGDSDIRNYYDKVKARQTNEFDPNMEILNQCIVRSALGTWPDGLFYTWNPLWQMDDAQKAELANKKANTFKIDVDAGLIEAPILREARINQLIEDQTYPGIEQTIEEMELSGELDEYIEEQEAIAEEIRGAKLAPANENEKAAPPKAAQADASTDDGSKRKRVRLNRYVPRDQLRGTFAATRMRKMPRDIEALLNSKMGKVTTDADIPLKTLYVYRRVLNAKDIIAHYKRQGIKTLLKPADMHVTVMYSKQAVDWLKAGQAYYGGSDGKMVIHAGGPRLQAQFGKAVVLVIACEELQWRHESIKNRTGATWDYPEYIPHITLTYRGVPNGDLDAIEPFQGQIELGPEIFEEIVPGGFDEEQVVEDALSKWAQE